ncbi:hypothetical protein D0T12_22025 [Actinomadura spongiicola]|uniref:Uncharacterized protein n=1 Tax=Actinomadura spongiicola TaxID=2303421 RepID=A0A372GF35_9ACTN|nr:hypothetical protein [Actinomadura spongiicola]RFS83693.1 hypothetical protein D0T12_22025 [Actinomadura spongiicola]
MTHHDNDPATLPDNEHDRLLAEAHDDLLRHIQAHTDPIPSLLAFMEDDTTPFQPAAGFHSRDLTILELRSLVHRTHGLLPEGLTELRDALLRADLPDPNTKYLALLTTLMQGLVTVCALQPAHELELYRELQHDLVLAQKLAAALDLDLRSELAFAPDLANNLYSRLGKALDQTLDRGHAFSLDFAFFSSYRTDIHHAVWVAGQLIQAIAAALGAVPVNLSGVDASHLRDMNLETLAGTVWDRATSWPESLRELVEWHSEEIRDGLFRVRGGTERDPHAFVLA